jgi:hypothetical protein
MEAKRRTCVADQSFLWASYNTIYMGFTVIDAGEANADHRSIWIQILGNSRSTRAAPLTGSQVKLAPE